MSEDKSVVMYNNKSDYQNKRTWGQKADGSMQLKETTIRSDERDGIDELLVESIINFCKVCAQNHIKYVSPFEAGHEPTV